MLQKIAKGFTLIELMIVVAIIGILAAIAIPNFVRFQCRSKQSEAKTNLNAIYKGQTEWLSNSLNPTGTFETLADADFQPGTTNNLGLNFDGFLRYDYATTAAAGPAFTAVADADAAVAADLNGDQWTIDNTNALANPTNGCNL